MLEKQLQAKIIKKLLTLGGIAVKVDASKRGWPDVTAVLPGGVVLFLEVKTATGRVSEHQQRIHQQLRELGANVHVIRTLEQLECVLVPITEDIDRRATERDRCPLQW